MRVLVLVRRYPQSSETYIETELRHLWPRHEMKVVSLAIPDLPRRRHFPYEHIAPEERDRLNRAILDFAPDVIHGHYVTHSPELLTASRIASAPFTVRAHSFDVLDTRRNLRAAVAAINDDACLGVLAFPFERARLVAAGVRDGRIADCWPVVDYEMFHDESPNGDAVMNVGACLPKKDHPLFLDLASRARGTTFDLYAMGYEVERIRAENARLGSPARIMPLFEHDEMPAQYKKHRWLVYTASAAVPTVGWPMAVAEAQAAGVGVCMQEIRPDLREFVGPAGFLFRTAQEALDIISRPFPDEMRRLGFEHARRSDVRGHIGLLEGLWAKAR
jgi:hypothetical protein